MKANYTICLTQILFLFISTYFYSCNEVENLQLEFKVQEASNVMMTFQSEAEYDEYLKKISNLPLKELMELENTNNFRSVGRASDEFYALLVPDNFKSTSEAVEYFIENKEYVTLLEEENGEYTLETALYRQKDRYLINKDHMFQIHDNVYKVFNEGVVFTSIDNINYLLSIDNNDYHSAVLNPTISVLKESTDYMRMNDSQYNCGTSLSDRKDNDRNRTLLQVEAMAENKFSGSKAVLKWLIRPYYRTLGIWYHCSRTITGKIKIALDFTQPNGNWNRGFYEANRNSINPVTHLDGEESYLVSEYNSKTSVHLGGVDAWGDTPSTLAATIVCNPQIIPF